MVTGSTATITYNSNYYTKNQRIRESWVRSDETTMEGMT